LSLQCRNYCVFFESPQAWSQIWHRKRPLCSGPWILWIGRWNQVFG